MFTKLSSIGSWYIHIIAFHLTVLLDRFEKLGPYSLQGMEHLHKVILTLMENRTQHGTNESEYWYQMVYGQANNVTDTSEEPLSNHESTIKSWSEFSLNPYLRPFEGRL